MVRDYHGCMCVMKIRSSNSDSLSLVILSQSDKISSVNAHEKEKLWNQILHQQPGMIVSSELSNFFLVGLTSFFQQNTIISSHHYFTDSQTRTIVPLIPK